MRLQVGETEPFIAELLGDLTATIQDLETHQIHMFYEAVGLMISADSDAKRREQYLVCCRLPSCSPVYWLCAPCLSHVAAWLFHFPVMLLQLRRC